MQILIIIMNYLFFIVTIIIIIFITAIIFLLKDIEIKIELKDVEINIYKGNKELINEDSKIYLKLYILRRIRIIKIDLKKVKNKKSVNRLMRKNILKNKKIQLSKIFIENKYKIEEMDFNINLGLEDASNTAIACGIISSILGNILNKKITNRKLQKYLVIPIFEQRDILKIKVNGIFKINVVNIISTMIKMRSVK